MGLLRGLARTAAVAGTATAVSNKVSRRQAARWEAKDQQQQAAAEPAPPAVDTNEQIAQLQQLGKLREQGILTDEEFYAKKQQILNQ